MLSNILIKILSKTGLKVIGVLAIGGLIWWGVSYITGVFRKAKEYDVVTVKNASLSNENKLYVDSLALYKESLAKCLLGSQNAKELYAIAKGTTNDFQTVIKVMRDSVIKINQDRAKLEAKNLELEKDLERAKKKRRFL